MLAIGMQGLLKMVVLETIMPRGKKTPSNFRTTQLTFNFDAFIPKDKMELHRKTGEGVFHDIIKSTMNVEKLHNTISTVNPLLR